MKHGHKTSTTPGADQIPPPCHLRAHKPMKKQVAASAKVSFESPVDFTKAVKAVRSDTTNADWCLVGYKDDSVLGIVGSGKGGLKALLDAAEPFGVNYGVLRVSRCLEKTGVCVLCKIGVCGTFWSNTFQIELNHPCTCIYM